MSEPRSDIEELSVLWASAERNNDAATLDKLLAEDFTAVGPLGFVLTRVQWLDRYREAAFVNEQFEWTINGVRSYGDSAVVIGIQNQTAAYRGHPSSGQFRVTQIMIRRDGRWQLAGLHLSPIAQPEAPAE
ncbi:nuclear transport factor 2 family protein [Arthrobacter sp. FW306-2-2C-D06B]|uniref:nuclear transport factor 2 family protein n=1 Tax=Arthrobacter sp. FW306-2-2C-D06B TaxID=2879618 RepID=UPI001F24D094|nr:nuclear transport factor 2 family protein [Arthrobacter sp. FW306-2-2C-D06B]UKA58222.1 nuclear transport factor 2 family protein [Arthrobacter sp. FW306-2-2C-D06B]